MTEQRKYINDNPLYGVLIDWNLALSIFNSLEIPDDVYNPTRAIRETVENECRYNVGMSKRSTGKTTNYLIIGIILWWLYGVHSVYIRQREDMISPKNTGDLFDVIIEHGYISKITDDTFNTVVYRARRWFFVKKVDGEITDQSDDYFCFMCDIEHYQDIKSGFNDPLADWLIYDEFISKMYYPNEFVDLCHLISTIKRKRRSTIINMLANCIDIYSIYFNELSIADEVQKMPAGSHAVITSPKGTKIYVERIEPNEKAKRQDEIDTMLYFGFVNPKMAAITGDDWAMDNYPHIPDGDVQTLYSHLYIYYNGKYARLDIVMHDDLGICCYAHWATRTHDDSIILTAENRTDSRYVYRTGRGALDTLIRKLFNDNRVYYATNDVGNFCESYLIYIRKIRTPV